MMRTLVLCTMLLVPCRSPPPILPVHIAICDVHQSSPLFQTATWVGHVNDRRLTAWAFHGNPGHRWDSEAWVCAHPTAPFGSWLYVRRGTLCVHVQVVDRPEPPYQTDIDLSLKAARALGMVRDGRVPVIIAP